MSDKKWQDLFEWTVADGRGSDIAYALPSWSNPEAWIAQLKTWLYAPENLPW